MDRHGRLDDTRVAERGHRRPSLRWTCHCWERAGEGGGRVAVEHGICEIFGADRAVGLGFAVDRWHVLTCAHVVNTALGRRAQRDPRRPDPDARVHLAFPIGPGADGDRRRVASVVAWLPAAKGSFDADDVAVLELVEALPTQIAVPRPRPYRSTMLVQMWGPQWDRPGGGHVKGEVMGEVRGGRTQMNVGGGPFRVRPGFSGGPVWEVASGDVVGILSASGVEEDAVDAYLLGVDRAAAVWPRWQSESSGPIEDDVLGRLAETVRDVPDFASTEIRRVGTGEHAHLVAMVEVRVGARVIGRTSWPVGVAPGELTPTHVTAFASTVRSYRDPGTGTVGGTLFHGGGAPTEVLRALANRHDVELRGLGDIARADEHRPLVPGAPPQGALAATLAHQRGTPPVLVEATSPRDRQHDGPSRPGRPAAPIRPAFPLQRPHFGGQVVVWGRDTRVNMFGVRRPAGPVTVPHKLADVVAIAAGGGHRLALRVGGTVVAWGLNGDGQATIPAGLCDVVAIAAGDFHSLALRVDGSVVAWGRNRYGQASVPTKLPSVVAISAGGQHSVALGSDGRVFAWGANHVNQCSVPGHVIDTAAISAGGAHTLALGVDGSVTGWGSNAESQSRSRPTGVVAISAASNHSLALCHCGKPVFWGSNVGLANTVPRSLTDVVAVAAAARCNLALDATGTITAWGNGSRIPPPGLTGVVAISAGWEHCMALIYHPSTAR